jgi:hypothetical protein
MTAGPLVLLPSGSAPHTIRKPHMESRMRAFRSPHAIRRMTRP